MAKGKKFNDDIREKAFAMLATNNNLSEVAREVGVNESTLRTWKSEKRNDEFTKLRQKKKEEFVNRAWDIVKLGQELILKELNEAKNNNTSIDIGKLSTVIGTMYDKQALINDEATANIGITVEDLLKKVEGNSDY